jgi:hypothetical protein
LDTGLEISQAEMVIAHNLYLQNEAGFGSLVVYNKQFTEKEKHEIYIKYDTNILKTGYPYPEELFKNVDRLNIDVETGDYLVFRADYPHAVVNHPNAIAQNEFRVSWNGFFTNLYPDSRMFELVYWT